MLEQERHYYDAHLPEWLEKMSGRFVLVRGEELIGTYDTMEQALSDGARLFGLSSFLVRRVEPRPADVWIPALALGILNASPPPAGDGSGTDA